MFGIAEAIMKGFEKAQEMLAELPSMNELQGQFGEMTTEFYLHAFNKIFKDGHCKTLRNLYIPYRDGYSEVDIVMITSKKILVIENKSYSGWIFGSEHQQKWTQSLNKNQKYQFYNPIKQNQTHLNALSDYLQLPKENFISIIVFGDGATLKKVPENKDSCYIVVREDLIAVYKQIYKMYDETFTNEDIDSIYNKLVQHTKADKATKQAHKDKIRNNCAN